MTEISRAPTRIEKRFYHALPRAAPGRHWIVTALATEADPTPAPVAEFATEKEAVARAELLNLLPDLIGPNDDRDKVLRRMLTTAPKVPRGDGGK